MVFALVAGDVYLERKVSSILWLTDVWMLILIVSILSLTPFLVDTSLQFLCFIPTNFCVNV